MMKPLPASNVRPCDSDSLSSESLINEPPERPTESIKTTSRQPRLSSQSLTTWLLEILGLAVGFASFIAIAAVLYHYRNNYPPEGPITLSTVISVLATLMSGLLSMTLGSCIAQLKWNHFNDRPRPLFDFCLIDDASKGPLGSLKFLALRPKSVSIVLAAIAMLVNQVVGPFFQQIIKQSPQPVLLDGPVASMPVAYKFETSPDTGAYWDDYTMDMDMKSALYNGLYATSPQQFQVTPNVSQLANATWTNTWTLGICSECADLAPKVTASRITDLPDFDSSDINMAYNVWNLSLPNGHVLDTLATVSSDTSPDELNYAWHEFSIDATLPSISFADRTAVLIDLTTLYLPSNATDTNKLRASECILKLCAQGRNANVTNGTFYDPPGNATIQPFPANSEADANPWLHVNGSEGIGNATLNFDMNIVEGGTSINLSASGAMVYGLADFINRFIFQGQTTVKLSYPTDEDGDVTGPPVYRDSGDEDLIQVLNRTAAGQVNSKLTFADQIENIARSFTQTIRQRNGTQFNHFPDTASVELVLVQVRWIWISVPAAVLVITTLVLVYTVFDTARCGTDPWKSSLLAAMAFGTDDEGRERLREHRTKIGIDEAAKQIRVRRSVINEGGISLRTLNSSNSSAALVAQA